MENAKPAKKEKGIYKYVVHEDVIFKATPIKTSFNDPEAFLIIKPNGDIIVRGSFKNGYAWDGCTPKFNLLDLCLFGIPDGRTLVETGKPTTYYASMVHDILCQYREEAGISQKAADRLFLTYLGDFQLRHLYYAAVRAYSLSRQFISKLRHK